jgi:hypothetical protein
MQNEGSLEKLFALDSTPVSPRITPLMGGFSLAEQNPADWAAWSAADIYLGKGCQGLFENGSVAGEDLRKALQRDRIVPGEGR